MPCSVNPARGFPSASAPVTSATGLFLGAIGDRPRATEGAFIMATIANLTVKNDGSLEGTLATLSVTAPISLVTNTRKAKESEPVTNTSPRTYHNQPPPPTTTRT